MVLLSTKVRNVIQSFVDFVKVWIIFRKNAFDWLLEKYVV